MKNDPKKCLYKNDYFSLQKATAKCVEDQGGVVDGKYCLEREKPPAIIRSCNEFPCLPK